MQPAEYRKLKKKGQQFQESVPIRYNKTGNVLDEFRPLEFNLGGWLHSQTYVQLQHIYRVPANQVRVFHHGSTLASDVRLTRKGYDDLMALFGLVPQNDFVPQFRQVELQRVANAPPVQGHYDQNRRNSGAGGGGGGTRAGRKSVGGE
jgi:hypothetical protein